MIQLPLFDAPPLSRRTDPETAKVARPASLDADAPRLNRQCREVLARLQQGPATNMELAAITHRFGGRIFELRKAKYVIEKEAKGGGLFVYTLRRNP